MRLTNLFCGLCVAVFGMTLLTGCDNQAQQESGSSTAAAETEDYAHEEGHDHENGHSHEHPEEGPHGGHLIELGQHEYHGELVHDEEAGTVTVYILDGDAKKSRPIATKELHINLTHDDQPEQFALKAAPAADDPGGKSSRFVSQDPHLGEDLHAEGIEAQLAITIDRKPYNGKIEQEHDHDHEHNHGHEHEGDDHTHEDHEHKEDHKKN